MLSRAADALYWMSRYVERAEHSARVLSVTHGMLIDVAEIDSDRAEQHWHETLRSLGVADERRALPEVVFDENDAATVVSSISRARENARQVREVISSEMWENLNAAYWAVKDARDQEEELSVTLDAVVTASFLWSGVTDATMGRGEGWLFVKLGQFVERADRLSRLVSVRTQGSSFEPDSSDNVLWLSLLRSANALEAFRKLHPTRLDPRQALEFLVLDRDYPRTVRYCLAVANDFVKRLSRDRSDRTLAVQRAFGRLSAGLEYADLDEILELGVGPYLSRVLSELSQASLLVQRTYFLH